MVLMQEEKKAKMQKAKSNAVMVDFTFVMKFEFLENKISDH